MRFKFCLCVLVMFDFCLLLNFMLMFSQFPPPPFPYLKSGTFTLVPKPGKEVGRTVGELTPLQEDRGTEEDWC